MRAIASATRKSCGPVLLFSDAQTNFLPGAVHDCPVFRQIAARVCENMVGIVAAMLPLSEATGVSGAVQTVES